MHINSLLTVVAYVLGDYAGLDSGLDFGVRTLINYGLNPGVEGVNKKMMKFRLLRTVCHEYSRMAAGVLEVDQLPEPDHRVWVYRFADSVITDNLKRLIVGKYFGLVPTPYLINAVVNGEVTPPQVASAFLNEDSSSGAPFGFVPLVFDNAEDLDRWQTLYCAIHGARITDGGLMCVDGNLRVTGVAHRGKGWLPDGDIDVSPERFIEFLRRTSDVFHAWAKDTLRVLYGPNAHGVYVGAHLVSVVGPRSDAERIAVEVSLRDAAWSASEALGGSYLRVRGNQEMRNIPPREFVKIIQFS